MSSTGTVSGTNGYMGNLTVGAASANSGHLVFGNTSEWTPPKASIVNAGGALNLTASDNGMGFYNASNVGVASIAGTGLFVGGITVPRATLQVSGSMIVSVTGQITTPTMYVGTNGQVGVGTSIPGALLHVSTTASNVLMLTGLAGSSNWINFRASATPATDRWVQYLRGTNGGDLSFYDTADRLTLQAGGNIGIGTGNPVLKLDVNGNTRVNNYLAGPAEPVLARWAAPQNF